MGLMRFRIVSTSLIDGAHIYPACEVPESVGKLLNQIRGMIHNPLVFDHNKDYKKTVLLAGSGRGGTTWISELVNHDNKYRYIFEPLNRSRVPAIRHLHRRQYLSPLDSDPGYLQPIQRILQGQVRGSWVNHYNRKIFVDERLIKMIRANLILGWIHLHFPEIPIVFIMRHPFAVASSQIRRGWHPDIEGMYLSQTDLVQDHLEPFEEAIRAFRTPMERQMCMWCIDNYVPLKQLNRTDIHICFYEYLVLNPEAELKALFAFINRSFDITVMDKVTRPSRLSGRGSTLESSQNRLGSWKKNITAKDIEEGLEVLAVFGLDKIYNIAPIPDREAVYRFMGE